jgi:hypothetical protein
VAVASQILIGYTASISTRRLGTTLTPGVDSRTLPHSRNAMLYGALVDERAERRPNVSRSAALRSRAQSTAERLDDARGGSVCETSDGLAMSGDTTTSAVGLVTALSGASAAWPDELWAGSVAWMDALLRSCYGIYEFTDDPACVLRVGRSEARTSVSLSDGTYIALGEPVGTLHFWNEHMPRYSEKGPDLGWACAIRDRVMYSLRAFTEYIERDRGWREIRAIRTETALPARLGAPQIRRVFQRYGFERVPTDPSLAARLHGLGECVLMWALTRAFNPAALPRQPFLRDRHELWISRATLLLRYARRNRQIAVSSARSRGT